MLLKLEVPMPHSGLAHDGLPRIVDVAERQAIIVGDVVIDADQLFAPLWSGVETVSATPGKPPMVVLGTGMSASSA